MKLILNSMNYTSDLKVVTCASLQISFFFSNKGQNSRADAETRMDCPTEEVSSRMLYVHFTATGKLFLWLLLYLQLYCSAL